MSAKPIAGSSARRLPHSPATPMAALLAAASLGLGACATTGSGDTDCNSGQDPLTGARYRSCGEAGALDSSTPLRMAPELLRLAPVETRLGDTTTYYVRAQYQGDRWLYLSRTSGLGLVIDGQTFSLTTPGGSRPDATREINTVEGQAIQEAADFITDAGMIRAIGMARVVDVRLSGAGRTVESRLSGPELEPFRAFVEAYLDD